MPRRRNSRVIGKWGTATYFAERLGLGLPLAVDATETGSIKVSLCHGQRES